MLTEPRVLGDFAGQWALHRTIDQKNGPAATFCGQASWTPHDTGLMYRETGELAITGQTPMQSTRQYVWHSDLSVFFDDGRFFHQVPAQGGQTGHWCDPDQYDVTYDFTTWPAFQVVWQVKGPRKDYTMISQYARARVE